MVSVKGLLISFLVSLGPDPGERPAGYSKELKTDVKADREEL